MPAQMGEMTGYSRWPCGPDGRPLETAALDLYGTELVVLSACDTGVGATEIRDDFLALVLAGARTQMVSLRQVGDTITRQLMSAYYGKLAQGMGRSQALREVQLELLRAPDTAHPNDWASFIVSGDDALLDVPMATPQPPPGAIRGPRGCACEIGRSPAESYGPHFWLSVGLFALGMLIRAHARRAHTSARVRHPAIRSGQ